MREPSRPHDWQKDAAVLAERVEELEDALRRIVMWCGSYPTDIFHDPSSAELHRAHQVLRANGMTLDAISAHAMRHALKGVGEIARGALNENAPGRAPGASFARPVSSSE